MERLPLLLTSTIHNACEQFRNITFTVHGENDKARISIMFTNQESIKSKRKSNSTIKRDNKRLREYNENNSDTIITECATNTQCSNNADNYVELVSEMDVEVTPNGTPTTLTGEMQSAENVNIDLCVHKTGKSPDLSECVNNNKDVNTGENVCSADNIEEIKVAQEDWNLDNNSDFFATFKFRKAKDSTCDKPPVSNISVKTKEIKKSNIRTEESEIDDSNMKTVHDASDDEKCELISKFVLKKSKFTIGKLICKIEKTGRLIVLDIDSNTYEELVRSDRYYKKFNTVLTQDFSDVRETQHMNAEIEQAILQMIDYAKNKKLL
ncbi:Hypothetical predicted protein [Mytilus galloprovincialis]|uniref:Uncharacterized protein n=1 Tax=Mytilus galloprovincialis TaxID=29158 RepID=A0A8B6CQN4_MYTGA|nr:Hypothetical predicted protein [Mytilus galloprovincialis]